MRKVWEKYICDVVAHILFHGFAQMGIPTYGVRVCAQVRDDRKALTRTVHELFIINLVMTGCLFSVRVYAFNRAKITGRSSTYIIMSAMILLNTIGVEWLYRALEEYTFITIRSLVFKIIAVVGMFLLVRLPEGLPYLCGIDTCCVTYFLYTDFCPCNADYIYQASRGILASAGTTNPYWYSLQWPVQQRYTRILIQFMLGFMKTDADVGDYNTAIKIKKRAGQPCGIAWHGIIAACILLC